MTCAQKGAEAMRDMRKFSLGVRSVHLALNLFVAIVLLALIGLSANAAFAVDYPFSDDMEDTTSVSNWTADSPWAISDDDAHSDSLSWSDSPDEAYSPNTDASLTLSIALTGPTIPVMPVLSFWHKYSFEKNVDFGYVEVSTDGGGSWMRIYAVTGVGGPDWYREKIDLTPWLGRELRIRFRVRTNESGNYDGWHIDDVKIDETETPVLSFPFYDDMNDSTTYNNWHSSSWELSSPSFDRTTYWSSSPQGRLSYRGDNTRIHTSLTLANNLDLRGAEYPQLVFWHKMRRRETYRVQVTTNNGASWENRASYSGNVDEWTRVQLDLTSYFGLPVRLRFYVDGENYWYDDYYWYIEDIMIQEDPSQTPMVDYCQLESPDSTTAAVGTPTEDICGLVYEEGVTDGLGQGAGITAQLGYGAEGSSPAGGGWNWVTATYNTDVDTMDQYVATLTVGTPGTYDYAYRYQLEGSNTWIYADLNGNDSGGGGTNGYTASQAGKLVITGEIADILGDVNNSNTVNITDALIVATYDLDSTITIPNNGDIQLGDVNKDNIVNITDALIIATYDIDPTNPDLPPGIDQPVATGRLVVVSSDGAETHPEKSIAVRFDFSETELEPGKRIDVAVNIDMTGVEKKLGAYSAALYWDPEVLSYAGCAGGSTEAFDHPLAIHEEGRLRFNQFNVEGAGGNVNIIEVSFLVKGKIAGNPLSIKFSALTAAYTFHDLLPYLQMPAYQEVPSLLSASMPEAFSLSQNYPNPFNAETTITYDLPIGGKVNLSVYNINGQRVKTLVDLEKEAGSHSLIWDGKNNEGQDVASGIYLYRLKTDGFVRIRRMVLIR